MSDAKIFLSALFGDEPVEGFILVWTNPGKRSRWFRTAKEAATYAGRIKDKNVYVGLGLSPEDYGPDRRCLAEEIVGLTGVRADIDIAGTAHAKGNLPKDLQEARAIVDAIPLPPTMIVHTGYGLQAYWLFRETWTIDNDVERREAATLVHAWDSTVRQYASRKGFTTDSTWDLARVFRIPGTFNVKDPADPKPVTIIEHHDERRYNPEDFEEFFAEDISAYIVNLERPADSLPIILDRNPKVPMHKFEVLCEEEPRFRATWNRKRKDFKDDDSFSAYDMALASFCVRALWTDQEIADLIVAFRLRHGDEKDRKKAFRIKYVSDTIRRARSTTEKTEGQAIASKKLETALDGLKDAKACPSTGTDPEAASRDPGANSAGVRKSFKDRLTELGRQSILESLSEVLELPILGVKKFLSEPPEYELETAEGKVRVGRFENIQRQSTFQRKIAEATDRMIPSKIKKWDKVCQGILSVAVHVEVGEEATQDGVVREWLVSYLQDYQPTAEWEKSWEAKRPYVRDGKVHIFLAAFREWLTIRKENIGQNELAVKLRSFGAVGKIQGFKYEDGAATTRSVYVLPKIDGVRIGDEGTIIPQATAGDVATEVAQ